MKFLLKKFNLKKKIKINKNFYLFLFYWFYYNKNQFSKKNNYYWIKIYNNYSFFYYIYFYLILNKSKFSILLKIDFYNKILMLNKNNYLFLFLYLIKKNIHKIKSTYIYILKELKIFYFFDFILRIEFLYFIKLSSYFEYFKVYKYNEYLNNQSIIYNYPLIYILLKIYYKMGKLNIIKKKKNLYNNIGILNSFTIYGLINNLIKENPNKQNKISLILNKNKFIKNLYLFTLYLNKYILYIFKYYIQLLHYIYYYKIFLNFYDKDYFIEIKKLKINSLSNLYKQFLKNKFEINNWINLKVFLNLNKISNNIFYHNYKYIYSYDKIYNIWSYILELVIINYISNLFFKFYLELNFLNNKKNKVNKIWIYSWIILKRNLIFNRSLVKEDFIIKNPKYILDFLLWRLFFISYNNFYKFLNYNLYFIKINIDSYIYFNKIQKYNLILYFCTLLNNLKQQKNLILNFYNYKNLILNFYNKLFKQNFIFNEKQIKYLFKLNKEINNYNNYKIKYYNYYLHKYNIILIIIFYSSFILNKKYFTISWIK